jgi:hypothetical protein
LRQNAVQRCRFETDVPPPRVGLAPMPAHEVDPFQCGEVVRQQVRRQAGGYGEFAARPVAAPEQFHELESMWIAQRGVALCPRRQRCIHLSYHCLNGN